MKYSIYATGLWWLYTTSRIMVHKDEIIHNFINFDEMHVPLMMTSGDATEENPQLNVPTKAHMYSGSTQKYTGQSNVSGSGLVSHHGCFSKFLHILMCTWLCSHCPDICGCVAPCISKTASCCSGVCFNTCSSFGQCLCKGCKVCYRGFVTLWRHMGHFYQIRGVFVYWHTIYIHSIPIRTTPDIPHELSYNWRTEHHALTCYRLGISTEGSSCWSSDDDASISSSTSRLPIIFLHCFKFSSDIWCFVQSVM